MEQSLLNSETKLSPVYYNHQNSTRVEEIFSDTHEFKNVTLHKPFFKDVYKKQDIEHTKEVKEIPRMLVEGNPWMMTSVHQAQESIIM